MAGVGAQLQIALANLLHGAHDALLSAATVAPVRTMVTMRRDRGALWRGGWLTMDPDLPASMGGANPVVSSEARPMGVGVYVVFTPIENHGGRARQGRAFQAGTAVILRLPALPTPPSAPGSL